MTQIRNSVVRMWSDRRAQDLVEYALLCALVAAVSMAVFPAVLVTSTRFSEVMSMLSLGLAAAGNQ
jgi:Flp pilus assembly pilin Flp